MTKLKKLRLSLYGMIALALALGVGGAWEGIKAYSASKTVSKTVIVQGDYIEASNPVEQAPVLEPEFGAVSGPALPNPNCTNDFCTAIVQASFADSTSTIFAIASPFLKATSTGAGSEVIVKYEGGVGYTSQTTTVDLVHLEITGPATSSFKLACGAYTRNTGVTLPLTRTIVSTTPALAGDSIPTSTVGMIENDVSVAEGAVYAGGTTRKMMLGSDAPFLVCVVNAVDSSAFTNGDNTFTGKIVARFLNHRF